MSPESLTHMSHSPEKTQRSQAELRAKLANRLQSLKPLLDQGITDYQQALNAGTFDDQEGEEPGQGEKRKEAQQKQLNTILAQAERLKERLVSPDPLPETTEELSVPYTYTNPDTNQVERQETITIDFEAKLQDFLAFYQSVNLDLPPDFADSMRDIWSRHQAEIEQAITEQGFDDLLLIPANLSLPDLKDKMSMESGYATSSSFDEGGGFASAQSQQDLSHPRLLLVHNTQNLRDRPELAQTLNTKGQDVKLDQALTLEDYLIFQRKYYADTNKHLDEDGWTWLATKSGARLVRARWYPGNHQLNVSADDLTSQFSNLGVRPTRCFS